MFHCVKHLPRTMFARSASHAVGTEGQNRTGTPVKEADFESERGNNPQ